MTHNLPLIARLDSRQVRALLWVCVLCVLLLSLSAVQPAFLTMANFQNVLLQASVPTVVALGMTVVIVSGHIDLSVGSVAALASIVLARLCAAGVSSVGATVIALAVGVCIGILNGVLVGRFGVPSFVSSLGIMGAARGCTLVLSDGRPLDSVGSIALWLGGAHVAGVPVPVLIAAGCLVLTHVILRKSALGLQLFALGGNPRAAWIAGLNSRGLIVIAMSSCSLLAALAGVVISGRLSSAQPLTGNLYEMDAITAVVLGGGGLAGGRGSAVGSVLAAFLLAATRNAMILADLSPFYHQILIGGILITVAWSDARVRGSQDFWLR